MKRKIFIMCIAFLLFFSIFAMPEVLKKDISTCSVEEIAKCNDIGPKLAKEIKEYAVTNNIKTVDQIHLKYVGDKRKEELKKKFK